MSEAKKDLKYFLEHTDEMPTDPKELERLANEQIAASLESGSEELNVDDIVGKPDEIKGEASVAKVEEEKEPEVKPEAKAEETPKEEPKEEKPEGILAKDGKNVIPYSQLESARQRATAAETLAKQQAEELATLKSGVTKEPEQTEMLTDEELDVLEADSPTLAKTLRSQQAAIKKLSDTVGELAKKTAEAAAAGEAEVKSEIQTAIDANPTLAAWQTDKDQTLWNEASRFDKVLRESPKYRDVPFSDRFAKVVELTQSALGLEVETPKEEKEEPTLTPAEVKVAAKAKLASVAKAKKPLSLTDIPGGAPPAVDEREKLENMSSVALGNMLLNMTKEQQEAYLASL